MELFEARKAARYSQDEVAGKLGISRPTYAKMEKDPGSVTIDDAVKLAKLFGVTVGDIFLLRTIVKPIVRKAGKLGRKAETSGWLLGRGHRLPPGA